MNQLRVMEAFREHKFSEPHMGLTTGYGYDDIGREKIEEIFADIMGAEKAYVRIQISSGTQPANPMRAPSMPGNHDTQSVSSWHVIRLISGHS